MEVNKYNNTKISRQLKTNLTKDCRPSIQKNPETFKKDIKEYLSKRNGIVYASIGGLSYQKDVNSI